VTARFPRLKLAHLPTPLWRHDALDALVGTEVWVKRDDLTGSGTTGNKVRKLEFLMAAARAQECDTVITCGGTQSNHCRATALVAAELGLRCRLLLREGDPGSPPPLRGNLTLAAMAGAELTFLSPEQYARHDRWLERVAEELRAQGRQPYVIPEGGSSGLGALAYVEAMAEVRRQLEAGEAGSKRPFDTLVTACGTGGTAAGAAIGAALHGVASSVMAMAVTEDQETFSRAIRRISEQCRQLDPSLPAPVPVEVADHARGPHYAIADVDQLRFMIEVCTKTGLLLDPVYTGKALYGLSRAAPMPGRVLFLHTGGLPGLLSQADAFDALLTPIVPASVS